MTLEGVVTSISLESLTGYGSLVIIALLVITRKLVWHKDLEKAEKRAQRWENVALEALGVAERSTIQAEVTHKLLSNAPDPAKGTDR